jgi:hypothetical protein
MTNDDPRAPGAGRVEGTNELHWKGGGLVGNHNPTLSTPTMSTLPGSLRVPNPIAIEHLADIIDTHQTASYTKQAMITPKGIPCQKNLFLP